MYTIKKHQILADVFTPIVSYQRIREKYPKSILFESSEYAKRQNNHSIIVFDELSHISAAPSNDADQNFIQSITGFKDSIKFTNPKLQDDFNGIFGFSSFNAVTKMETIHLEHEQPHLDIPAYYYGFFRFVLVFDHFNSQLIFIENIPNGEASKLGPVIKMLQNNAIQTHFFETLGKEECNNTADQFMQNIAICKAHCQQGDTFQLVISRQFSQAFIGDEFNVYRTLRSLNPSPYLFYADFGSFKLLGSSPEAQIIVQNNKAEIHPIAGTYKFTGNETLDKKAINDLKMDPKENSEHVMLVDLARNDLSRHCDKIRLEKYKEIQEFSHVIHLVSRVTGQLFKEHKAEEVFAHTFPAGTLSGAPKIESMKIINKLEGKSRSFYGGAIGYFSFNNATNHAIIIRSFCSKDNKLYYQAGAGVVIDSILEKELEEVDNKLGALRKALKTAEQLHLNFTL